MKLRSISKLIGIMVFIACYILFPLLKIKYFDSLQVWRFIYSNLLIPILCIAVLGMAIVYFKYLKKFNQKTNSKIKIVFQDLITTVFLACIGSAVLIGMTFSTVLTTNAYCGQSKDVRISGTVVNYSISKTKWGRQRHLIEVINADDHTMTIEVYRKYEIGQEFNKEMKIGKWGLLYSIN